MTLKVSDKSNYRGGVNTAPQSQPLISRTSSFKPHASHNSCIRKHLGQDQHKAPVTLMCGHRTEFGYVSTKCRVTYKGSWTWAYICSMLQSTSSPGARHGQQRVRGHFFLLYWKYGKVVQYHTAQKSFEIAQVGKCARALSSLVSSKALSCMCMRDREICLIWRCSRPVQMCGECILSNPRGRCRKNGQIRCEPRIRVVRCHHYVLTWVQN